ncbi:helix-turn-helix transcriptional regulator [Vibrio fluvialis]|nr:helix-turn-helix transcriptional regulator [Vibrio fluvialis]
MKKCDPIVSVLRRYRELSKISQEEMARKTGISVSTVQRIESGRTHMNLDQYRRYLKVLNISDMDVSIALYTHEFVTELDVAAAAKKYPFGARKVIAAFLHDLFDELNVEK